MSVSKPSDSSVSKPSDFEELKDLLPKVTLTFEQFGHANQEDINQLKKKEFPNYLESRIKLQSLWCRHPSRHCKL